MKESTVHLYEGMYVLSAHLPDDARKKAFEKIKEGITARGGEVLKVHEQGKKKLAYEIKRQREGYYYLLYFNLPSNQMKDMWQEYEINESLLRFLTMQTEKVLEEITFKPLPEV